MDLVLKVMDYVLHRYDFFNRHFHLGLDPEDLKEQDYIPLSYDEATVSMKSMIVRMKCHHLWACFRLNVDLFYHF